MDLSSRGAFEQWCKSKSTPMLRVFDQYWLTLDPDDDSLTPCLVRDGYWESWVSLAVARAVRQGWSCVDVGANVGYYTLLMLASGAGRVMAIEAHPRVAQLLKGTVVGNKLENVISVREVAVGAVPGKAKLNEYARHIGSSSLLKFEGYEVTRSHEVQVAPLDILLASWKTVDFIKMDVEGAEWDAWLGMEDVVSRCGPTICMEIHEDHGYDVNALLGKIRGAGYDAKSVSEDGSLVEPDGFRPWTLWLTKR